MFGLVATLYRSMALQHVSPLEVDEMELWQVAVALGRDEVRDLKPVSTPEDPMADLSGPPKTAEELFPTGMPSALRALMENQATDSVP